MSFARFVRALRMGLGNRHGDPKVAQGLELFRGRFRHSAMAGLLDMARKLREIFGEETDLLESFNQDAACWATTAKIWPRRRGHHQRGAAGGGAPR